MKNLKSLTLITLTTLTIGLAHNVVAANPAEPKTKAEQPANTANVNMTEGEVKKIDKSVNKITLKHGAIQNLDMPGMTMVFKVSDPAMLDTLKQGDKVKFKAEKVNGVITVTHIETITMD